MSVKIRRLPPRMGTEFGCEICILCADCVPRAPKTAIFGPTFWLAFFSDPGTSFSQPHAILNLIFFVRVKKTLSFSDRYLWPEKDCFVCKLCILRSTLIFLFAQFANVRLFWDFFPFAFGFAMSFSLFALVCVPEHCYFIFFFASLLWTRGCTL